MAELQITQIVISKQGKDKGLEYVVAGFAADGRVKLIRPAKYNMDRPKLKNSRHLQGTLRRAQNLEEFIKAGKNIDAGYFYRSVLG